MFNKTRLVSVVLVVFLTILALMFDSKYLNGFPVFLYTIFPWGMGFLILETFLFNMFFIFSLLRVKNYKFKYLFFIIIILIYLLINALFYDYADIQLPVMPFI